MYRMTGHHREHWQDQPAVYIGLRYPRDVRKRRRHRRHRLQQPSADEDQQSAKPGNKPLLSSDHHCCICQILEEGWSLKYVQR